MNYSKFRFTLDMHSSQSQISVPAMIGDTARMWCISFTDGGIPYTIEDGSLAMLTITRPKTGAQLVEFCKIRNNSVVEYPFDQNVNTCAVDGIHHCELTLYDSDGGVVASPKFTMVVSETVVRRDDIELSADDYTAVDAMVKAEVARAAAENARAAAEVERDNAEQKRVAAEEERKNASTSLLFAADTLSSFDKRITNIEQDYLAAPFVTHAATVLQCSVPANALPYATINAVGGRTTAIKSMSDNLLFGFKRADESKFVRSINDEGALALLVNGSQQAGTGDSYIGYNEMVGTLPAGRYSLTWTADTPIEDPVFDVLVFTPREKLSNSFELSEETTIYLQIVLSEISDQIIYPVIADVNGEMMVERDRYVVPEEIVAKDGWEKGVNRLFLQDGTYYNSTTKEYTDVREFVGNDHHIMVAPGGKLLFESTNGKAVYSYIIFTTKKLGGDS